MPLNRQSKIKEVWQHPVGHHLLGAFLQRMGRNERWIENPLVAGMPLSRLDRMAGPGFSDMVVSMAEHSPEKREGTREEKPAWWKEAVVYNIYLPSFMDSDHDGVGDLRGVIQRLPYFEGLGVDTLWMWPLADRAVEQCSGDYRSIRPDLGDVEDFKELVREAHNRDMHVVMGMDISATSSEHHWFCETLGGKRDGFYILQPGSPDAPPNNWSSPQGPVWRWYPEVSAWGLHLGGRHRMDLNWENAEVRAEITELLKYWQAAGVDGFLLGPVNTLSKRDYKDGAPVAAAGEACGYEKYAHGPKLHRYLREVRAAVPEPLMLAGEVAGVGAEMAKLFTGEGHGELDLVLDTGHITPHRGGNKAGDGRLELEDIKQYYLRWMRRYGSERWMALFLETAETPRIVSRLGASPLYRGILAKMLAMMLLTLRGTPIIYQGQELGLANTRFSSAEELRTRRARRMYAELGERFDEADALEKVLGQAPDHCRTPMPWASGPRVGFTGAAPWMRIPDGSEYLNVNAQMQDAGSVWSFYRQMIELRRSAPCLLNGSFNPVFTKNKRVFCYFRIYEGSKWYVELNLTEREITRPGRITANQKLVLSNYDSPCRTLRPYEANLYRCD